MKKKVKMTVALVLTAAFTLTACTADAQRTNDEVIVRESEPVTFSGCVAGCTCSGCICCGTNDVPTDTSVEEPTEPITEMQTENTTASVQTQPSVVEVPDDGGMVIELTEGELAARREQQANFAKARETLYKSSDSLDKTEKINQMDRQILANNAYDFGDKTIVFIGDSITEGITSSVDQNGNYISYVTYVNSYLHFENVLNHGKGGRMFSAYGGDELSLAMNFGNVTNINSDIIVVFAGVNDYLCVTENKHFGSVNDTLTTGNYCGSVRSFMSQLQEYYGDREIFFVTMYDINKTSSATYADFNGQPTLGDFMDAEKKLAKEFGFHIIDLYGTGFMDCSSKEASDYFLRDGLHPKDSGSIYLGEHIAAELSLYFGQKEGN
ncbi:MAG: SGNH/GDSL hydrolase family protein [Lachnospiraceae bacterium]|nr:SGNH/GDSL hydrolase family protein [Lachnospiraceae bacterium]